MSTLRKAATVVGISFTTVVVLCVGAAVACDSLVDCSNTAKVGPVKDDPGRVAQLFPAVGPVTATHWQAREARPEGCVLVVCHEIPIRYALNAADGSDDLDGPEHTIPNAIPYLFDRPALERAAQRIDEITR